MREKLETLSLVDLRAIAKENGIKNLTIMRKKEIIDRILEVTERKAAEKEKPAKRGPGRPRKTEVREAVTETKTEKFLFAEYTVSKARKNWKSFS